MKKRALVIACVALAACAGVLGLRKNRPEAFPHRKHVLSGIACTKCHVDIGQGSALHLPDQATCIGCHTKPHDSNSCFNCHGTQAAVDALNEARDHLKFDHGRHLPRANNNCMRCHVGVAEGDERLRPTMAVCFKCHEKEQSARQCDSCHRDLETDGEMPASHLAHDGNWLRDHGARAASSADLCQTCHTEKSCAACHGVTVAALPAMRRFADPFTASVHRAGFAARHSLEAKTDPAACQSCHQPERCATCHIAKGVAGDNRASPHPPGWVGPFDNQHGREARRDPAACASCHGGAGEQLCVQCHKVGGVGGNIHPPGWRSNVSLGSMPCRLCHPIGAR